MVSLKYWLKYCGSSLNGIVPSVVMLYYLTHMISIFSVMVMSIKKHLWVFTICFSLIIHYVHALLLWYWFKNKKNYLILLKVKCGTQIFSKKWQICLWGSLSLAFAVFDLWLFEKLHPWAAHCLICLFFVFFNKMRSPAMY